MPFDGKTYDRKNDLRRLSSQLSRVRGVVNDGQWRTLDEILDLTKPGTVASVSARLRDLRKTKFGGHTIDRRHRGDPKDGVYEYRLATEIEPSNPDALDKPVVKNKRLFG